MAQSLIQDNESGLDVRTALNNMFTELYGNIVQPIKILSASANVIQAIAANTMVVSIFIRPLSGAATLRIGTSPNGEQIMSDTLISIPTPIQVQQYFDGAGNLYFTWTSGASTVNIRIDVINNYN